MKDSNKNSQVEEELTIAKSSINKLEDIIKKSKKEQKTEKEVNLKVSKENENLKAALEQSKKALKKAESQTGSNELDKLKAVFENEKKDLSEQIEKLKILNNKLLDEKDKLLWTDNEEVKKRDGAIDVLIIVENCYIAKQKTMDFEKLRKLKKMKIEEKNEKNHHWNDI